MMFNSKMKSLKLNKKKVSIFSVLAIAAAILIAFPFIAGIYQASILSRYLVFGIFAMSFDLLWGYAGIINFSQAAFFGIGAYSVGMVMKYLPLANPSWIALLASVLVPIIVAIIIGYFLFYGRVSGICFAVITMVFSILIQSLAIALNITGGLDGLRDFSPLNLSFVGLFSLEMSNKMVTYYVVLFFVIVLLLISFKIVNSSFGRALEALRDNPERLESMGYNIASLKLIIFVIACGIAGIAGALYVPIGYISPEILGLLFSTNALVWVSIGGRRTLVGPFLGALIVSYLQYFLGASLQNYWLLIIGAFFIVIILFKNDGLLGFFNQRSTIRLSKVD